MVVDFIDNHKHRFVVEPICRVLTQHWLKIAPSTYYAARSRLRSARALRDEKVLVEIKRVEAAARGGVYGAKKVWRQLRRNFCPVFFIDGPMSARI